MLDMHQKTCMLYLGSSNLGGLHHVSQTVNNLYGMPQKIKRRTLISYKAMRHAGVICALHAAAAAPGLGVASLAPCLG